MGALKPRWKLDRGGKLSGSGADKIFRALAVARAQEVSVQAGLRNW